MEEIFCDICSLNFDHNEIVPKVLPCGHTICCQCLEKLLIRNALCPKCRAPLSDSSNIDEYPVNYSLLSIVASDFTHKNLQRHHECYLIILKNKYLDRKEEFTKKRNAISSNLEIIKSGLTRIQELLDGDPDEMASIKMKQVFVQLENDLKTVNERCCLKYWERKMSITLHRQSFESSEKFILEIYHKILDGQKFIYLYHLEDKFRYGELSTQENMLLIHALSSEEIPQGVETVLLEDLKKGWEENSNARAFLKISCNVNRLEFLVIIKMLDFSLTPQFVRLCTGEDGPCYKGSSFAENDYLEDGEIVKINNYINGGTKTTGSFDYYSTLSADRVSVAQALQQGNQLVLDGKSDGSFQICQSFRVDTFLGRIESPSNLESIISRENDSNSKVIDCGFLFKL